MNLQDFIPLTKFQISDGSEYLWKCYGNNARYLDFSSEFDISASCIFDTNTQMIYEVTLFVKNSSYRWIDPAFYQVFLNESFDRNIDPRKFNENQNFCELELESDLFDKTKSAFETGECSNQVTIQINLSDDHLELFKSLPNVHNDDDINNFISSSLVEHIKLLELENSNNWDILFTEVTLLNPSINISIDKNTMPLSKMNIDLLKDVILKSGLTNLHFVYTDHLTRDGLISIISTDEIIFKYSYQFNKIID